MSKFSKYDSADYLEDAEDIIEYLKLSLVEDTEEELKESLNTIARSKGISDLARKTGLSREAIYKALGEDGNPRLSTLMAIVRALGLKLKLVA